MLVILTTSLAPLTLAAAWILLWLARRYRWRELESTEAAPESGTARSDESPQSRQAGLRLFITSHAWSLGLAAALLGLVIYLILVAPPSLPVETQAPPGEPGRPFFWLRWLRSAQISYYDIFWGLSGLLGLLAALGTLIWAGIRRSRTGVQAAVLLASLNLAMHGQWAIGAQENAAWYYLLAGLGILTWAIPARKRLAGMLSTEDRPSRALEILIVLGLLGTAAFTRLIAFPAIPYGYEGDETKWTAEAVNVMIDGRPDHTGEYHRDSLPASFYMQAPFHRLLGAGMFAARLEVILFSIAGTLAFYWLARQIAPRGLAALAAYLLSVSIFDISASRLANVESHVKFWPILALALLALALRKRKWQLYALSGLALAIGLLTYDTVWPVTGVVFLLAYLESRGQDTPVLEKVRSWAALAFPVLLTLPVVIPYAISRLMYYDIGNKGWKLGFWEALGRGLAAVVESWFVAARPDFIYNRQGPLLNALLLPWLFLGFVAAWTVWSSKASRWSLIWAVLLVFPVPLLAYAPLGRVYYPGLPAVYALAALGLFLFWKELARLLGPGKILLGVFGLAVLAWLPLLNLYIYFNETGDGSDRLIRREIGDIVQQAGGSKTVFILPVFPDANEPLNNEHQIIELSLHDHLPPDRILQGYRRVAYSDLLAELVSAPAQGQTLEVLLDKTSPGMRAQRDQVGSALQRCFPGERLTSHHYFDRFTLDNQALGNPACLPVDLNLEAIETLDGMLLKWSLSGNAKAQVNIACGRERKDLYWVEAESFSTNDGWLVDTAYATGWSGAGFLMDQINSQEAVYNLPALDARPGIIWVRSYRRVLEDTAGRISAGGQSFLFAEATAPNTWEWERLGPVQLPAGAQTLRLSRPYSGEPRGFMALFVDALLFSQNTSFDPRMDPVYEPVPEELVFDQARPAGQTIANFGPGTYRCQAQASAGSGLPLVDSNGNPEVLSQLVFFELK